MKLRLAPEAADELEAARASYEGRRSGLGDAFVDALEATLTRIGETPALFACLAGSTDLRRASLARFPYVVIFMVRGETAYVLAVAHARRKPAYWAGRAPANESDE